MVQMIQLVLLPGDPIGPSADPLIQEIYYYLIVPSLGPLGSLVPFGLLGSLGLQGSLESLGPLGSQCHI